MKDEIKEILDRLKEIKEPEMYITPKTCKQLLDYITNLQEELKYQKEMEEEYNKKHTELMNMYSGLKAENETLRSDFKNQVECATNLQEEKEKYKRYVDETFLYTYEELQDKVLKLQKDNNELSKKLWNEVDDRINLKEKSEDE